MTGVRNVPESAVVVDANRASTLPVAVTADPTPAQEFRGHHEMEERGPSLRLEAKEEVATDPPERERVDSGGIGGHHGISDTGTVEALEYAASSYVRDIQKPGTRLSWGQRQNAELLERRVLPSNSVSA